MRKRETEMQMPTLKLLSTIFEEDVTSLSIPNPEKNEIAIFGENNAEIGVWNVYELMHLCKTWALCEDEENGFGFFIMDVRLHADCCTVWIAERPEDEPFTVLQEPTEPETIFRACEKLIEIKEERYPQKQNI